MFKEMIKVIIPNNMIRGNSNGNFLKINDIFIAYSCYMVEYHKELDSVDLYYFSFELLHKRRPMIIKKITELISNNNMCLNDYLSVLSFFADSDNIKYCIKDYGNKHIIYVYDNKDYYRFN